MGSDGHEAAPLSPTLKRKRGDSSGSIEGVAHLAQEAARSPSVDSDASVVIDEDDLDDLVESLATTASDELASVRTPAEVRQRVREIGVTGFTAEVLEQTGKTPQELGRSFGLDAEEIDDPEIYMLLLERILVHALTRRRKLPQYNTLDDAAELLKSSRNIMIITGAGISTSLGIPDFRSKHTGFYSKLQEIGFSEPEEVFDIHIFDDTPDVFYSLAGDILPKGKEFTPTHGFIRLVQDQGRLQTNYTQNIDNLEANAGIESSKVIQCHGSFATASCRKCRHRVPGDEIFDDLRAKRVAYCKRCIEQIALKPTKKAKRNNNNNDDDDDADDNIPTPGVMKPDITFFGEQLPDNFFERFLQQDSHAADLVIVIGTSLKVAPVADMPNHLPEHIPHIYISREPCQHINFDIQLLGDCDAVCWELCRRAGWDLKHDMIPKRFAVEAETYNETQHQWKITSVDTPETTATTVREQSGV